MGVRRLLRWIPILLVLGLRAAAQVDQFLPEIGLYYKPAADVRLTFQAKETREGGDPVQAELGPSVDFYLKPLIRLRMITKYEVDDSKKRPLVFSIGYRYLPSPNTATVNRLEPVITSHFSLTKFLLSDRNRADLDWKDGKFTWRYRNQFQVERRMTIHSYHPAAYSNVEFFYQSQYSKWSETAVAAGGLFPIKKRFELNPYYEHQNNTGKRPNQQLNQLGLKLSVAF